MFRKTHLYLTILCAGITASILFVMSFCCLYISERSLYRNQFGAFQNDVITIATALEQQSAISMEWLSKMEARSSNILFVLDNNVPFLYNQLKDLSSDDSALPNDCLNACRSMLADEAVRQSDSPYAFRHVTFPFSQESSGVNYFAGVIEMERDAAPLHVVILSPLEQLEQQIRGQRLRFVFLDLAAAVLLTVFSFLFTGKLLQPIAASQKKQTEFIAAASHELRTPLAVMLSCLECCYQAPADKQAGFLKTIQSEGLRMSSLIDDMLTLSQSDNKCFSLNPGVVELDTLLLNVFEAFEPLAREQSIALSVRLPEESPKPCQVDADRIRQTLFILLHNAVSYTPAGGHITLSLDTAGNAVRIVVADTGIGIAQEDKKKIFERFYRVEKSRSAKGHFGLGLSIAYEIVKLHRGTITVSDNIPKGSVFTIMLPCESQLQR